MKVISFIRPSIGTEGHSTPYHHSLGNAALSLGWDAVTGVGTSWPAEHSTATMKSVLAGASAGDGRILGRLSYVRSLRKFILRESEDCEAIIFVDWASTTELLVLTSLLGYMRRNPIELWFMLRRMPAQRGLQEAAYRLFIARAAVLGPRFKMITDSSVVADLAKERWQCAEWTVLPIPHIDAVGEDRGPSDAPRARLWWAGFPRPEKGLDIIRWMARQADGAQNVELILPDTSLDAPPAEGLKVTQVPAGMPRARYAELLMDCDIVLVPYRPANYRDGTSGVFVEAICAGRLPVVTAGTWMAGQLGELGLDELVLTLDAWRAPDILVRLSNLARDEALWGKFNERRKRFVRAHGEEAFAHAIEKLAPSQAPVAQRVPA